MRKYEVKIKLYVILCIYDYIETRFKVNQWLSILLY